jgi:beta-galactosidase
MVLNFNMKKVPHSHYLKQRYKMAPSIIFSLIWGINLIIPVHQFAYGNNHTTRQRISINDNWKFFKYTTADEADSLIYAVRPDVNGNDDTRPADSKPTQALTILSARMILKPWILPTGNDFIRASEKHFRRPEGNPGADFPFVQSTFDDGTWETVDLPHDWAIAGPFFVGPKPEVGGGMGRLPSPGVAWYRKKLHILVTDAGKSIFLDIDVPCPTPWFG